MLSIGTRTIYGLSALLILAERSGQPLLTLKEISSRGKIPRQYLEQIFNRLGKAEIIASVRGKHGGYRLARPPAAITVFEVVELLEGGLTLAPKAASLPGPAQRLFQEAEARLKEQLAVSLAELVERIQQERRVLMFNI